MLELFDIEVMYNITSIIEANDDAVTAQEKCKVLIDIQKYLSSLNESERCDNITLACLYVTDIKKMFKLYNTYNEDKRYVTHIRGTEILWSEQCKKYVVNDRDVLYYSIDDKEELLGYIIHKLGNVISVPRLMNIFTEMTQSIQSFSNYIKCCNYIKYVRNSVYNLSQYNWFVAQMKLYYSSKGEI